MAVVMSMHWPEVGLDGYEKVRKDVKWETNVPKGAMFHVAWMAEDGFRVIDIWKSSESFQRFNEVRLVPAVARAGLQGQPNVTLAPAHAIFAPDVPTPRAAAQRASGVRMMPRSARPAKKAKKAKKAPAARTKKAAAARRKR